MRRFARTVGKSARARWAAYKRIANSKVYAEVWAGRVARVFEAYADTIAQTMVADIMRGLDGGTYYMDGRSLDTGDRELWAVGGAKAATEIALDADETEVYTDVLAACELLREVIVELQSDGVGDLYIGWWRTDERGEDGWVYCFDVSNVVRGEDYAVSLGAERGEDTVYNFAEDRYVKCR